MRSVRAVRRESAGGRLTELSAPARSEEAEASAWRRRASCSCPREGRTPRTQYSRRVSSVSGARWASGSAGYAGSEKQVGDRDRVVGSGQRRHLRGRAQDLDRAVAPLLPRAGGRVRLAMDLDDAIDEIHDPVLAQARPRVDRGLEA